MEIASQLVRETLLFLAPLPARVLRILLVATESLNRLKLAMTATAAVVMVALQLA